jgi:hypothetical protein
VDEIFSLFVSEEVDKVELLYTKFVSLIKSEPVIHTLLPLSPQVSLAMLLHRRRLTGQVAEAVLLQSFSLGAGSSSDTRAKRPSGCTGSLLDFEQSL